MKKGHVGRREVRRVGEPNIVTELGDTYSVTRSQGDLVVYGEKREAWDYAGSFSSMPIHLIFSNGALVEKVRGR